MIDALVEARTRIPEPVISRTDGPYDDHHPYYPECRYDVRDPRRPATEEVLGLFALRQSRVQRLPRSEHLWLHAIFDGPYAPGSPKKLLGSVVLSAAGYIPPQGIIVYPNGKYETTCLDEEQRQALWESGQIRIAWPNHVKIYLLKYAFEHGLDNVTGGLVDEFLHTKKQKRREQLSRTLLEMASEAALDPARLSYQRAYGEGLLPKSQPAEAHEYVSNLLLPKNVIPPVEDIDRMEGIVRQTMRMKRAA